MQLLGASKPLQIALQASLQLDECYLAALMQSLPFFLPHITAAGILLQCCSALWQWLLRGSSSSYYQAHVQSPDVFPLVLHVV